MITGGGSCKSSASHRQMWTYLYLQNKAKREKKVRRSMLQHCWVEMQSFLLYKVTLRSLIAIEIRICIELGFDSLMLLNSVLVAEVGNASDVLFMEQT
jgi:hypothetical protein